MSDIIACEALNCRVTEDEWDLLLSLIHISEPPRPY